MSTVGQQGSFPEMPEAPRLLPDLSSRNAFARAVTPAYWDIDPAAYSDIDPRVLPFVAPDKLRPSLIDVPFGPDRSPSAVAYFDPEAHRYHNVALTPGEFTLVSRGVGYLARQAVNKTLASRLPKENFEPDKDAAKRAGIHITEHKQERMRVYRDETLLPRLALLDRFLEAAQHPGFARMSEADMRIKLGIIRDQIFDDMFIALRQQRAWDPEQELLARRTLDRRLFLERKSNEHLHHWKEMMLFNREYLGHKTALFSDRIAESKRYIRTHAK